MKFIKYFLNISWNISGQKNSWNFTSLLVSSSSAGPWPGALPLQLRDPNYGNGDTNTFSKRLFEQFTQYLTGWQICQLPLSSEGSKLFSFRGFCPLTPLTRGSAPGRRWGLRPRPLRYNPPLQTPWPRHCCQHDSSWTFWGIFTGVSSDGIEWP